MPSREAAHWHCSYWRIRVSNVIDNLAVTNVHMLDPTRLAAPPIFVVTQCYVRGFRTTVELWWEGVTHVADKDRIVARVSRPSQPTGLRQAFPTGASTPRPLASIVLVLKAILT